MQEGMKVAGGGGYSREMGTGFGNSLALFLTAVRLVFSCKLIP